MSQTSYAPAQVKCPACETNYRPDITSADCPHRTLKDMRIEHGKMKGYLPAGSLIPKSGIVIEATLSDLADEQRQATPAETWAEHDGMKAI